MLQFAHCMNWRKNNQIDMKFQYGACLRICVIFLISRKRFATLMREIVNMSFLEIKKARIGSNMQGLPQRSAVVRTERGNSSR